VGASSVTAVSFAPLVRALPSVTGKSADFFIAKIDPTASGANSLDISPSSAAAEMSGNVEAEVVVPAI
jgi:hypothetical protein